MIHLGDITKIDGKRIEPVDVIVGGSPCQDLSVAGKRAGLAGERSGLYMDQIRIIKEMRDADHQRGRPDELCRPRYMVWENVPGAFSSQKGADFAAVIEEVVRVVEPQAPDVPVPEKGWPTAGCIYDDMGRWSVAWRVHDAQFWGVPQRRRRIALVADFGGLSAPEVLFERKGLRGDPAQSGTPRQGAAADAEGSSGGASRTYNIGSYHSNAWKSDNPHSGVYETEVSKTLDALNCGYPACNQGGTAVVCMATQQGGAEVRADDRAGESAGTGGDGRLDAVSGGFCQESAKARSIGWGEELAPTLTAGAVPGVVSAVTLEPGIDAREGGQSRDAIYCLQGNGIDRKDTAGCGGKGWREDVSYTLNTIDRPAVVAFAQNQRDEVRDLHGVAGALEAEPGMKQQTYIFDMTHANDVIRESRDVSPSLQARMGTGGNQVPLTYGIGNGQAHEAVNMAQEVSQTLNTMHDKQAILYQPKSAMEENWAESKIKNAIRAGESKVSHAVVCEDVSHTPRAKANCAYREDTETYPVQNMMVRRLTPLECERLQGYPCGWTDIGEWVDSKGKRHDSSDSARYKALGNSIALPFWFWLMRRISAQYVGTPTLGSLFDGIGGFPLCWERINGKGTALWASEIEEFPIAVTKYHFGG